MGLDIYLHKVKVLDETKNEFKAEGFRNASDIADEQNRASLKKALESAYKYLDKKHEIISLVDSGEYAKLYEKRVKSLFKYYNYPEFYLKKLGVSYDYATGEYSITPTNGIFELQTREDIVKKSYAPYIAYWRKVNFIYAYFDRKGLLDHESECAWVDVEDIKDIISRCEKVLADKNDATNDELLPTQSGFFFGSTEYDGWYYSDVKDTIKKLEKVLKDLKDDEQLYIAFSW